MRPWRRTRLAAVLLSMLAFTSPTLTLAPLNASEPGVRAVPATARSADSLPRHPQLLEEFGSPFVPEEEAAPPTVDVGPRYAAALDAARATGRAYGVTFAAVSDGEVAWSGASGRERGGQVGLSAASPLVIGSVTKTFVAATVLQLVDEGRIRLSDPVRRHLPELRELSGKITVEQLLDHTSGLADLFNDTTRSGLEDDPTRPWAAAEVLGTLHDPWYEPGEGWAYANTNYYVLGMMVEAVTGTSLADELEARFIGPLGLDATELLDGADPSSPLSEAWTTIFWGSGAMVASAVDLARWGDALYSDDLLAPATRTAMRDVNSHDYGLGLQRLQIGGVTGYGHTGLLNTYTTLLFHVPSDGVTIALLVNRSHVDLGAMLTSEPPGGGPSLLELALSRR